MKSNLTLYILTFFILTVLTSTHYKSDSKKRWIECSEYTEKFVDKITGVKRYIAKEKLGLDDYLGKNGFHLVWFRTREEYTLAFKATDKLCFANDVAVSFHLLHGKVVTCVSSHIKNCESLMTVNFNDSGDGQSKIQLLSESEVVGISFENGNDIYKLKLRRHHSIQFQQTLDCLKAKR